jgi:hypothetical protein
LTPQRKPEFIPHAGNETLAAFVGTGGRLRSERMAAFNRNPWPQSSESACRSARARRTPVMWHDWNDSLKLDEVIEEARCMIPLIAMKQTYK